MSPDASKYFRKSRLCRRLYTLPLPRLAWLEAEHSSDRSPEEAEYISNLLEICQSEQIDVVFPASCDTTLGLLAKYQAEFRNRGITIVVPEFEAWRHSTDKYLAVEAARDCGFPCPLTMLCHDKHELLQAARELGYPLVVKGRVSSGSRRVMLVRSEQELLQRAKLVALFSKSVVVQEYVPGSIERSLNFVIDSQGDVVLQFALKKLHYLGSSYSTAVRVTEAPSEMSQAAALLRRLGLRGFVAIQTKIDCRDGRWKLIEVNPRFGNNARILFRFGINLAELCLRVARREPCRVSKYAVGKTGVSPVEDWWALDAYFSDRRRRDSAEAADNPLPTLLSVLASYASVYCGGFTVDYYLTSLLRDPRVACGYYLNLWRTRSAEPRHFVSWGDLR